MFLATCPGFDNLVYHIHFVTRLAWQHHWSLFDERDGQGQCAPLSAVLALKEKRCND
jgi:hypothetical protein